jgi:energy-coupling factor transporter ATP-binding protein EcfA2
MFMRAVVWEEERVGMLLFDEPSAALDPTAEHGTSGSMTIASPELMTGNRLDLFTRIRKLKGEKTIIFSSHRFGQLTRPADIILYVTAIWKTRDPS